MELNSAELELVRVALAERQRGQAKHADPENPFADEGAAAEVEALGRLLARVCAAADCARVAAGDPDDVVGGQP